MALVILAVSCAPAESGDVTGVGSALTTGPGPSRYVAVTQPRLLVAPDEFRMDELAGGARLTEWLGQDPAAYVVVDARTRRVVHATGRLSAASAAPDADILREFVRRNAAVLDLADPDRELATERGPVEYLGSRIYRLRQVREGVPVMRRSVKIEIAADGSVRTLGGLTSSDLGVLPSLEPAVSKSGAVEEAELAVKTSRPGARIAGRTDARLMIVPGAGLRAAKLAWRLGVLALEPAARGQDPHAWLVSLDAHDGTLLGMVDTTRGCTDGQPGPLVTSSELVRASIDGEAPPAVRAVETCYSSAFDAYFLEDHRSDASLFCYDAEGDTDPMGAAVWYSTCPEPACYTVSNQVNEWTSGVPAQRASDFRNGQKVLDLFKERFERVGADGAGENLVLASGMAYDNARSMGMYRTIAIGAADEAHGRPSWGVLDVLAHEFTHMVSWHEWVGFFDYGFEGGLSGAERAVDEHLADMFGVIALAHAADEPWVADVRWAHGAEHQYRRNYLSRSLWNFQVTVEAARNYYQATNGTVTCGHVSQIVTGADDVSAYTNAILLGRAVYLFTEGGFVDQDPYGSRLADWPPDAPTYHVDGIGTDKMEKILYHSIVTGEIATSVGVTSYGSIGQIDDDPDAMKRELEKVAHIQHASCLAVSAEEGWPGEVCASVRAAYAGVGLLPVETAGAGEPCEADENGLPCAIGRCVDGVCQGGADELAGAEVTGGCGCAVPGRSAWRSGVWLAVAAGLGLRRSAPKGVRRTWRMPRAGRRRPSPGSSLR